MLKGFRDFILRGNVVDLAVAVVVGAAFTGVVTALSNQVIKPLVARSEATPRSASASSSAPRGTRRPSSTSAP